MQKKPEQILTAGRGRKSSKDTFFSRVPGDELLAQRPSNQQYPIETLILMGRRDREEFCNYWRGLWHLFEDGLQIWVADLQDYPALSNELTLQINSVQRLLDKIIIINNK